MLPADATAGSAVGPHADKELRALFEAEKLEHHAAAGGVCKPRICGAHEVVNRSPDRPVKAADQLLCVVVRRRIAPHLKKEAVVAACAGYVEVDDIEQDLQRRVAVLLELPDVLLDIVGEFLAKRRVEQVRLLLK